MRNKKLTSLLSQQLAANPECYSVGANIAANYAQRKEQAEIAKRDAAARAYLADKKAERANRRDNIFFWTLAIILAAMFIFQISLAGLWVGQGLTELGGAQ